MTIEEAKNKAAQKLYKVDFGAIFFSGSKLEVVQVMEEAMKIYADSRSEWTKTFIRRIRKVNAKYN